MEIEVSKAMLNDVKKAMADIKNGSKNVLVTSINKTLTTVKTQAAARIGNELNLKAARIKEDFSIQKANYSSIKGAVIATGEPVGLVQFGARQTLKGVTHKVMRSKPRSLLKHGYIATGRGSDKKHVLSRMNRDKMPAPKKFKVGKKANAPWPKFGTKYSRPADRKTGPRIEDIYAKDKILDPIITQANFLFLKNVDSKITDILRRNAD